MIVHLSNDLIHKKPKIIKCVLCKGFPLCDYAHEVNPYAGEKLGDVIFPDTFEIPSSGDLYTRYHRTNYMYRGMRLYLTGIRLGSLSDYRGYRDSIDLIPIEAPIEECPF